MSIFNNRVYLEIFKAALGQENHTAGLEGLLNAIDAALRCHSCFLEFDGDGSTTTRFDLNRNGIDFAKLLSDADHEDGPLLFRLINGTSHQDICIEPNIHLDHSGETAPLVAAPVRKDADLTLIFAAVFVNAGHNATDRLEAMTGVHDLLEFVAPVLEIRARLAEASLESRLAQAVLADTNHAGVLIDDNQTILADTGYGVEMLARMEAAQAKSGRLHVRHRQLEIALQDLRSPPLYPKHMQQPGGQRISPSEDNVPHGIFVQTDNGDIARISLQKMPAAGQGSRSTDENHYFIATRMTHEIPAYIESILQDEYGLSQTEAHLARQLATTGSMSATVERLGVTRNTGKTHLRRIFDKIGLRTQLELACLVHKLVILG